MEKGRIFRLYAPLVVLVALGVFTTGVDLGGSLTFTTAVSPLGPEYRDLSPLLPDGIVRVEGGVSIGSNIVISASTAQGRAALVTLDGSVSRGPPAPITLPFPFYRITKVAVHGTMCLVAGQSPGSLPVLGLYDVSTGAFEDLTDLLPEDVLDLPEATGLADGFVLVMRNSTGLHAVKLDLASMELKPLETPALYAYRSATAVAWNGSVIFVAGKRVDGRPGLVTIDPSTGEGEDLADLLPPVLDRIDSIIVAGEDVYLLGVEDRFWDERVVLASYRAGTPDVGVVTGTRWEWYEAVEASAWNGTAILAVLRRESTRSLAIYEPGQESSDVVMGVLPRYWNYVEVLPRGPVALLLGNDDGPVMGKLYLDDLLWEDESRLLGRAYVSLSSAVATNGTFVVIGSRYHRPGLLVVEASGERLEDMSRIGEAVDGLFKAAASDGERVLIVGSNSTGAVAYLYDVGHRTLQDVRPPSDMQGAEFVGASWDGSHFAVLGNADDGAVVLTYNPTTDEWKDLSRLTRTYFSTVGRSIPFGNDHLLIGQNRDGPAIGVLDADAGRLTRFETALGDFYGSDSLVLDGAWNGESVLLGGATTRGPLLALWSPEGQGLRDLTVALPEDIQIVTRVIWSGSSFLIAGIGKDGPVIAEFIPSNSTLADLSRVVPPSSATIIDMAALDGNVLVLWTDETGAPRLALLSSLGQPGILEDLRNVLVNPSNAVILGAVAAVAGLMGYAAGRRHPSGRPPTPGSREPKYPSYEVSDVPAEDFVEYRPDYWPPWEL